MADIRSRYLTVGVGSYLAALFMAFVPFFNPTKRSFGEVAMVAPIAVLNVVIVSAVVLLVVDLLFRAGGVVDLGLCNGWRRADVRPVLRARACLGIKRSLARPQCGDGAGSHDRGRSRLGDVQDSR